MSDMTDDLDCYDAPDFDDPYKTVRERAWVTKAGDLVRICDMTDTHLLNAFNLTTDEGLFQEMVWRLFQQKIKEAQR